MGARRWIVSFGAAAALLGLAPASAEPPEVVPTFESLGISWRPEGGGASDRPCTVRYRRAGTAGWLEAIPLWFDSRDGEYRGSIVQLFSGTEYEVELSVDGAEPELVTAATWHELFPVSSVVELPETSSERLDIAEGGSADGYVVYTHAEGREAVIDVAGAERSCIEVSAPYVIIRGLTLLNAGEHAIRLAAGAHHVVIEDNDISGWGELDSDGWGMNYDAAVYSDWGGLSQVVVQRNRIHHPRTDSNCWDELRVAYGSYHPRGPQAVVFFNSAGNHVIRFNEIYSDDDHRFNDALGAGSNFTWNGGFPARDTDIYGNLISHSWDNAIEAEGENENVRIWGNYLDSSYVMIATASTSRGPLYVFRNVAGSCLSSPFGTSDEVGRGAFLKTSDGAHVSGAPGGGRIYVFHNTMLQPPPPPGLAETLGCGLALGWGGPMSNTTSRNNVFHVYRDGSRVINDRDLDPLGDYDYDLVNGRITAAEPYEEHGLEGVPTYDPGNPEWAFALDPSSLGFDAGVLLRGFNDDFAGLAPDMGAHEAGGPPMQFGVEAHRNLAPTAEAGGDRTVVDAGGDGVETVSLDGRGSSDPDGYVASFSWSVGGAPLGAEPVVTADLPTGRHEVRLEVVDNAGAVGSVTVLVTVLAPGEDGGPEGDGDADVDSDADADGDGEPGDGGEPEGAAGCGCRAGERSGSPARLALGLLLRARAR